MVLCSNKLDPANCPKHITELDLCLEKFVDHSKSKILAYSFVNFSMLTFGRRDHLVVDIAPDPN